MSTAFGDAIRAARKAQKMRQQDLADAIGMERSYLSKLENGDVIDPEPETRERVAKGLGITPNELMGYAGTSVLEERARYITDLEDDDLLQLYSRMTEPDRKRLVAIARALWILNAEG